jgi:hypothetical protein
MTRRRIVLIVLAAMGASAGTLAISGFYLLRGAPSWYRRPRTSGAAAASLEDKLVVYYDRMAAARAWRVRHHAASTGIASTRAGAPTPPAADPTLAPFHIQFSDEELNAFFDKWAGADNRRESKMDQYLQDPRILLQPGKLILAATVKDLGAVVSMEIRPTIDASGMLQLKLSRAYAGMLPLPDGLWQSRREQIQKLLERNLQRDQATAKITPDGVANGAAAAAGMKELLLDALANQPAAPVLFLPDDTMHPGRSEPVTLGAVTLGDGTIDMLAREMDGEERAGLLERLRKPRGDAGGDSAGAATAGARPANGAGGG